MKLRYLTLCDDLFKEHSPYTKEEMRCFGARLRQESAYITDYVKRGVNEEFEFDCARLNLCCTLSQPRDNIRKAESVHEIDVPFDMDYFSMTPPQKQQYLIDITENGLQRFCECEGWDFSFFKKHIDLLRSNPSFAEFYIPKKSCRKDQLSAKVYCYQNMTESIFFVDFFFNKSLIRRKFFAASSPDAFWYRSNIFRLEWSDKKTVSIYTWTDQLYAKVALDIDVSQAKNASLVAEMDHYKQQVDRVYRVKSSVCGSIDVDTHDCTIEAWEENDNGQIFVAVLILKKRLRRCFSIVNPSGEVVYEFYNDDPYAPELMESFKRKSGWYDT